MDIIFSVLVILPVIRTVVSQILGSETLTRNDTSLFLEQLGGRDSYWNSSEQTVNDNYSCRFYGQETTRSPGVVDKGGRRETLETSKRPTGPTSYLWNVDEGRRGRPLS